MSTWKAKALELLPELKDRVIPLRDRRALWVLVEREFYSARESGNDRLTTRCLQYAAWTLHPTPQAKTVEDVSGTAAQLFYTHADELYRWIDRYDFMSAQKGLRFHLGEQKYVEFEARFLAKTAHYPARASSRHAPS